MAEVNSKQNVFRTVHVFLRLQNTKNVLSVESIFECDFLVVF
jgi:hypothetical protein